MKMMMIRSGRGTDREKAFQAKEQISKPIAIGINGITDERAKLSMQSHSSR